MLQLPERHVGWAQNASTQLRGVDWHVGYGSRREFDSNQQSSVQLAVAG